MAVKDDIKARVDIVDVVADYVPELKRAGRNYGARCPFHQEQTPSFIVFPESQSWRCFGACAAGGDIFSFIERIEDVDFPSALKILGDRVGVAIPRRTERKDESLDPLLSLNDSVTRFYRDAFHADRGSLARSYAEQRDLGEESLVRFGIGYAPASGDDLLKHLVALGFTADQAVAAGVAVRYESGEIRDMLHGRLTFALRDESGRVVGFAGRSLDGTNPKYLNTPQTQLFDKGKMLYGLDRAKDAIKREGEVVVVEGYMDVITAHQYGYQNVVASMGTALTEQQTHSLRAQAPRVILAMDADSAGQEAMLRSLRSSWQLLGGTFPEGKNGFSSGIRRRSPDLESVRIALIVGGKDPDEIIRSDGPGWRELIAGAKPVVEFLLQAETSRVDISTSDGKAEVVEIMMPVIFAIPNWIEQDRYLGLLAERLSIPLSALMATIGARRSSRSQFRGPSRSPKWDREAASSVFRHSDYDVLDEHALTLLIQNEDILTRVEELSIEMIRQPENQTLLRAIRQSGTIEGALSRLDASTMEILERLQSRHLPPADRKQRADDWEACLRRMNERHLRGLKSQEEVAFADAALSDVDYVGAVEQQALETNQKLREVFFARDTMP